MEKIHDTEIMQRLAVATPKELRVSPSYISRLRNKQRPITVEIAERLGYDVIVTFERRSPAPEPE